MEPLSFRRSDGIEASCRFRGAGKKLQPRNQPNAGQAGSLKSRSGSMYGALSRVCGVRGPVEFERQLRVGMPRNSNAAAPMIGTSQPGHRRQFRIPQPLQQNADAAGPVYLTVPCDGRGKAQIWNRATGCRRSEWKSIAEKHREFHFWPDGVTRLKRDRLARNG
jgi:hypothetical protein